MSLQKENRHQVFAESFMSFAAGLKEKDESHIRLLVVLATKNVESAPFVVKSIEEHLPKMKLPLLYLVDSLAKEIGDPYKSLFATNIGHSFSIVYQKVRGSKKSSMLELRQSWSNLFPSTDLYALDVLVKSIDPEWPTTAPKRAAVSSKDKQRNDDQQKEVPEPKKRRLIPPKPIPVPVPDKVAIIPTDGMFSSENRRKLLKHFKRGFDSNYEDLATEFDGQSKNKVHYFFKIFDDLKEVDNKMIPTAEEIISLVRDDQQSKDLGLNLPLFVEWSSDLRKFPEPDKVGGVDYSAMAKVVASLLRGDIPAKLDAASASKLRCLTERFESNFGRRDNLPIPDDMTIPEQVSPVSLQQRNAILADRRRTTWSDEEMAERTEVLSPDLAQVRELYLSMPCFNPFKFPPE